MTKKKSNSLGYLLGAGAVATLLAASLAWANTDEPATENTPDAPAPHYDVVVLQGLNKVTGHISTFDGLVGTELRFGNLEIIPRRCWKSPPDARPENASILDIYEHKPDEEKTRVFLGWMFSSSPGLSGLEHPVYDITLLECAEAVAEKPEEKDAAKEKKS